MRFLIINNAFSFSDNLLEILKNNNIDTIELETHFVRSIVTLIISEYEVFIEDLFNSRASRCNDSEVIKFINKTISQKFRSPEISKINEILGKFSDNYKERFFEKNRDISFIAQNKWDNIMKARHAIVHKSGILQLTYKELKESYVTSLEIIDNLIEVLGI